jgi:hypothetical protein
MFYKNLAYSQKIKLLAFHVQRPPPKEILHKTQKCAISKNCGMDLDF